MDPNDIELVTLAKAAHDERAFAVLVRRHQARLRAFLVRLCGDGALADDIAQETFIKAHAALEEHERAAVLLCDAAGFSHSEAAVALEAPLGSVKTYVARARQKLRDCLTAAPACADEPSPTPPTNGICYAL